jgi:hypothetical protein
LQQPLFFNSKLSLKEFSADFQDGDVQDGDGCGGDDVGDGDVSLQTRFAGWFLQMQIHKQPKEIQ